MDEATLNDPAMRHHHPTYRSNSLSSGDVFFLATEILTEEGQPPKPCVIDGQLDMQIDMNPFGENNCSPTIKLQYFAAKDNSPTQEFIRKCYKDKLRMKLILIKSPVRGKPSADIQIFEYIAEVKKWTWSFPMEGAVSITVVFQSVVTIEYVDLTEFL